MGARAHATLLMYLDEDVCHLSPAHVEQLDMSEHLDMMDHCSTNIEACFAIHITSITVQCSSLWPESAGLELCTEQIKSSPAKVGTGSGRACDPGLTGA